MEDRYFYLDKETFESSLFRMGLEASHNLYKRLGKPCELDNAMPLPSDIMRNCVDEINNFTSYYKEKGELDGKKYQELYNCINKTCGTHDKHRQKRKYGLFYK